MSSINPNEFMTSAVAVAAVRLLGMKVFFERIVRFMSAVEAEGAYNGTDIYEVMQSVHDCVSGALGYLVPQEAEEEMRRAGMFDVDAEFEKMISKLEEGGHA